MMTDADQIAAKMEALGLWKALEPYNVAICPKGTVFPYFCTVVRCAEGPVKTRFFMLEGWQTMHDFVRTRIDRNFGFYLSPMEMPHFELVIDEKGGRALFRHDIGFMPCPANEQQKSLIARILWEVYGVMLRLETDPKLPLRFAGDRSIFARIERETGVWEDAPLAIPDPPEYVEKVSFPKEDLAAAKDLPFVREDVLEIDFRMIPSIMTKEARPRCVYGLKALDPVKNELVIDARASVGAEGGLRAMWEGLPVFFLKELIRRGRVPGEVKTCSGRVFRLMRPLCMDLPIRLSLHDRLVALDAKF